jgi:DNA invertase Pin-like site-specific DNA recombinase
VLAIGYVRSTHDRAELARHAGAIRRACERRGWTLEELVHDERARGATFERPGLASALERLSEPGPSRLVVSKLAHLSSSASDLTALFDWFADHDVQMVATDVGLDTTTPEGRRAAQSRLAAVEQRQARTRTNGRKRGRREAKRELAAVAGRAGGNDRGAPE